ncbi:hypothetical protein L7F22_050700 [Adiantum nelumboides]|nr:hypothetical protein [Adiantum nelumboides]
MRKTLLAKLKTQFPSVSEKLKNEQSTLPQVKACLTSVACESWSWWRDLKISYLYEEMEAETITWRAVELVPQKADLNALIREPSAGHIVTPTCSNTTELITLNPKLQRLSSVMALKSGELLLFVEAIDESSLSLYHCSRLGVSMEGRSPIKKLRRGINLRAIDELSRSVAMYDKKLSRISIFQFDNTFKHMDPAGNEVRVSDFLGSSIIVWMNIVPGKQELLLIDDKDRLWVYDLNAFMIRPKRITLPSSFIRACITPDSSCLFVFTKRVNPRNVSRDAALGSLGYPANDQPIKQAPLKVSVYFLNDTLTQLKELSLHLEDEPQSTEQQVNCKYFGAQMHLLLLSLKEAKIHLKSHVIDVTCAHQTFQLQRVTRGLLSSTDEIEANQKWTPSKCPLLDYVFHIFDKYAINTPLCPARHARLCILLNPPFHQWDSSRAKRNCEEHVASTIQRLKEKGKVFSQMLQLQVLFETLEQKWHVEEQLSLEHKSQIGGWIQGLLCLVPMQIARAENNSLKLLINGLQIPANANFSDAVSLASLIRFGLYDLVLTSWKGEVKVISSMGKQSSGKSYLNHLVGGLLDVAGGRCTDGVWMTLRWESDCLYVLLDFEGLGSFERSEQEDMFLSVLNAAISNVTIFNTKDFHLDKETETLFQQFQDGVSLVKTDNKLFKGLFYIAIKDVDASDIDDLENEFYAKISHICSKTSENFLTYMYGGEVEITALPPFQRPDFQESIADIGYTIKGRKASYTNGRQFIGDLKLVMSQISTRDWSPVDSKRVTEVIHPSNALGSCYQVNLGPLRTKFEAATQRQGRNNEKWFDFYQQYLLALIERRQQRLLTWLQVNCQDFERDGDVQKLTMEVTDRLAEVKSRVTLCTCKCDDCFLQCILAKGHASGHSCLGTHACLQRCSFCEEGDSGLIILQCDDLVGHDGAHDCKKRTHTCEKLCFLSGEASNCNQKCSLRVNHIGEHHCNSRQHMCKKKCSLPWCNNVCATPIEIEHEVHACYEKFCTAQCCIQGCTRSCVKKNHFHQLETGVQHFCANEHPCPEKCASPGICSVKTKVLRQTRSFQGKRSNFEYDDIVSEQSEDRKNCCILIPPFQSQHLQPHTHSADKNVVHFCDQRCPACDYYCELPSGHAGLHKTVHGNMRKMKFVSEVDEIDVLDRKYARGESGVAEMCNLHCKALGRGHVHLIPCPQANRSGSCTAKLFDGARHVNIACSGLDADVPLDKMTHETYWEFINFVDPCEDEEREQFALCDHFCRSEKHNNGPNAKKSYCTETLWHAPIPKTGALQSWSGGYVTEDGHHFACDHSKVLPHHVIFVIDKSGSMASRDLKPALVKFAAEKRHNNKLGCVFEAILRFVKTRMRATLAMQVKDSISVVLFDDNGHVAVNQNDISEEVVDQLLHYRADGGTRYSSGLKEVVQLLAELKVDPELHRKAPVVIFLSDGENLAGSNPVYMVETLKRIDPQLVLHTIMFGSDCYADILKEMARVGDGTFQLSLDEVQLARSFEGLAKSLKPKLAALCSSST